MNPLSGGILLIDKGEGETSAGIVRKVKRILDIAKVGHAGTLDPFATGLLIILLGQGTKLSSYLMDGEKRYQATIRLGIETDTLDLTGRVIQTRQVPAFSQETIEGEMGTFIGEIEQTPPAFSALKCNGQRAYRRARKGLAVDLKKRKVKIHRIEIGSMDLPDIGIDVICSRGTYIRSLAADFGKRLGTGGHLRTLRRLESGPFSVGDALNPETLVQGGAAEILRDRILSLADALPGMRTLHVDEQMAYRIRNGYQPVGEELGIGCGFSSAPFGRMKLLKGKELVAIIDVPPSGSRNQTPVRVVRVFN